MYKIFIIIVMWNGSEEVPDIFQSHSKATCSCIVEWIGGQWQFDTGINNLVWSSHRRKIIVSGNHATPPLGTPSACLRVLQSEQRAFCFLQCYVELLMGIKHLLGIK